VPAWSDCLLVYIDAVTLSLGLRSAECGAGHAGGTRFIGLYLARQLVEEGHEVTLYTRGKKPVDAQVGGWSGWRSNCTLCA
jgi:hypothetical protein